MNFKVLLGILALSTLFVSVSLYSVKAKEKTNRYKITIVIDATKANGKAWDAFGGKPDAMFVIEKTTYFDRGCLNRYRCTTHFTSKSNGPWYIQLYDRDIAAHDPIGNGTVNRKKKTRVGRAVVFIE